MNVLVDGLHWWNVATGSWIVAASVQAGLVAGVVLIAVRCFPRMPAHWRYALLLIALCKFAVPPYAALPTGLFSRFVVTDSSSVGIAELGEPGALRRQQVAAQAENLARESSGPTRRSGAATSAVPDSAAAFGPGSAATPGAARTELLSGDGASGRDNAEVPTAPVQPESPAVVRFLAAVYVSGAALGLLYLAMGLLRVRRWRQQGRAVGSASQWVDDDRSDDLRIARTAKRVPVLISRSVRVPMSAGLFRPVILFPPSLESLLGSSRPADVRKVQTIVVHELAHHARGDLWVNLVQKILLCLWWFHPVMWWLDRDLRDAREDCCDDAVLNAGVSDGYAYSRVLLEMASLTRHSLDTSPLAIAMACSRNSLAHRIRRAMDDTVSRHRRLSRLGWVLSGCVAFVLLPGFVRSAGSSPPPAASSQGKADQGQTDSPHREGGAAKSEDQGRATADARQLVQDGGRQDNETPYAADTPEHSVQIVVLDEQGNPIPGARVWRIGHAGGEFMQLEPTDADGRTMATGKAIPLSPFGHPVKFLAWNGSDRFGLVHVETRPLQNRVEITCRRHYRTPLTVHAPDGKPLQGAKVAVQMGRVDGESSTQIPDDLREKLQTTTDEDGIANAFFVSSESYMVVEVVSDQYGMQFIHLGKDDSKSAPLELRPTGRIEGRVNLPEGAALSDIVDDYVIVTDSGGAIDTTPSVIGVARVEPDAAGRFTIPHIVAGPLRSHMRSQEGKSRWQVRPVSNLRVDPGETASVTLNVDETRRVVGTVVEGDTGDGIPGVIVIVNVGSQEIRRATGESGEFSFFALPGQEGFLRYFPPDAYYLTRSDYIGGGNQLEIPEQSPDDASASSSEAGQLQPYQIEPMKVKRGATVRGKVVDKSGDGIGDARVWITWFDPGHRFSYHVQTQTRDDGSFAIKGVPPNQSLKLSAAKRGVPLVEKELAAAPRRPLRLAVEAPKLAAFRIRVVDSNGEPVSGVRVEIHRYGYGGPHETSFGSVYDSQTDAAGFVTTEQTHPIDHAYTMKVFSGSDLLTEKEVEAPENAETITATLVVDRD